MDATQEAPDAARSPSGFDRARAVADAVLYEGYLLYPYRKSSPKNRVRWQFGVLAPRNWIEARGPVTDGVAGSAESWFQQTECLIEAAAAAVLHVRVRFLQVQAKAVQAAAADGFRRVERLEVDGQVHLSFDEAVPREVDVVAPVDGLLAGECAYRFAFPTGEEIEPLVDGEGRVVGRLVRSRDALSGVVRLSAEAAPAPFRLVRLRVRTENTVDDAGDALTADVPREQALRRALVAAHSFLALTTGSFVSLLDPPEWASAAVSGCTNLRTFPVLVGAPGSRDTVLSSPIILYDHPQVAPESPGDLFDATEIDEILSLRTLTLTEEEKREVRATDPRAAEIVDRVDHLPPELHERLHGAIRSLRPASAGPAAGSQEEQRTPWWDPGADASVSPETDTVTVDGIAIGKGSAVRLRPRRRGTDAADMFLTGRTARVAAVLLDVDGSRHVAVTVDDDPGAELHEWYGRYHYFSPEELEPLSEASPSAGKDPR